MPFTFCNFNEKKERKKDTINYKFIKNMNVLFLKLKVSLSLLFI